MISWGVVAMLVLGLIAGCGTTPPKQGTSASSENKTVNIGYVTWAEDVAVTYLWKEILEEKGYEVNAISLDVAPLFVGLNKGDLDVFLDSWLPLTHKNYWEKYKNNFDDYGQWYEGEAKIGLIVPQYVDIKTVAELKDKADQFDHKMYGIDPGASMMKTTEELIANYALDFELVASSEVGMMTALDKAYRNQKPVVITGWSPHWMFAKYDLKYLEDPKQSYGAAEGIHTLANKQFTQNNPEVVKMLKAFKMNDQQIGSLESLINSGMEPQDAARKWISENSDLVDSWLK